MSSPKERFYKNQLKDKKINKAQYDKVMSTKPNSSSLAPSKGAVDVSKRAPGQSAREYTAQQKGGNLNYKTGVITIPKKTVAKSSQYSQSNLTPEQKQQADDFTKQIGQIQGLTKGQDWATAAQTLKDKGIDTARGSVADAYLNHLNNPQGFDQYTKDVTAEQQPQQPQQPTQPQVDLSKSEKDQADEFLANLNSGKYNDQINQNSNNLQNNGVTSEMLNQNYAPPQPQTIANRQAVQTPSFFETIKNGLSNIKNHPLEAASNAGKNLTFGLGNLLGHATEATAYQLGGAKNIDQINQQKLDTQKQISTYLQKKDLSQKAKDELTTLSQNLAKEGATKPSDVYDFAGMSNGQVAGESIGALADLLTLGETSSAFKTILSKEGVSGAIKFLGTKEGAKFLAKESTTGAVQFGVGGLGQGLQQNQRGRELAGTVAKSALTGAVAQPTLGVSLGILGKGINKLLGKETAMGADKTINEIVNGKPKVEVPKETPKQSPLQEGGKVKQAEDLMRNNGIQENKIRTK